MAYNKNKKRTGTVGKLTIEQVFINEAIKRYAFVNDQTPELCIYPTLVGQDVELPRHREQCAIAGVREENMVAIDRVRELSDALKIAAPKVGYVGHVLCGDFCEITDRLLQAGAQIPFLDFDGTDTLGAYHFDMLHMIDRYADQIGLVLINASLRNYTNYTPKEFVELCERTTGRHVYHMSYYGEGPMGMFLLSTEPIEMARAADPRHDYAFNMHLRGIPRDVIADELEAMGYPYVQGRQINNWIQQHRTQLFAPT